MTSDQQLQTVLRELPVPEPSSDFFDRLEVSLHEELAKPEVVDLRDAPRRRPWFQWRRFPAWVAAAAAIALLAAVISVAVTLIREGDRVPEVVETPTGSESEAAGELDFSAIAGTWAGALYPSTPGMPARIEVTIEPTAAPQGQVAVASYAETTDGPIACTSRWMATEADPPNFRVLERGVGAEPCPGTRIALQHDPTADTLAFEFVGSGFDPVAIERAADAASGPDLLGSSEFAVPFVIDTEVTGLIQCQCAVEEQEVGFRSSMGELVFTVAGPKSIDAWQRKFAEASGTSVTEPFLADVGGTAGTAIDATMGDENSLLYTIAPQPGQVSQLIVDPGARLRVISLELDTDDPPSPSENWIVSVIISAPTDGFDEWLATVEPLLESLRWEVSP